jgi:hypothetical protein
MAIKTKVQLQTDIAASTFGAGEQVILDNIVDSYEDVFASLTTVQRDALTPTTGLIIYNTDNAHYEYWDGSEWFGIGQNISTPIEVKVSISSAQLLASDVTPITIKTTAGAGYALTPTSMKYRFTYGSSAYAGTFTNLFLICSTKAAGSSTAWLGLPKTNLLAATSNRSGVLVANTGTSVDAMVEDDDLVLKADGTVTTGDGTLDVWVTYSISVY